MVCTPDGVGHGSRVANVTLNPTGRPVESWLEKPGSVGDFEYNGRAEARSIDLVAIAAFGLYVLVERRSRRYSV
jgi:hypothetical protein